MKSRHFPNSSPNLLKISTPQYPILFVFLSLSLSPFDSSHPHIMKVHPLPKKRNIAIRDAMDGGAGETLTERGGAHKRLRRLPHVFGKVLELPFPSDADVSVEESPGSFRFVVAVADGDAVVGDGVRVHAVEVHPGVTKIVVRNGGEGGDEVVELLLGELDVWRFRLPAMTRPELATAVFVNGELIVTVPKSREVVGEERGGVGQLVLVQ